MNELLFVLLGLPEIVGPLISSLIGLIALDVLLAVAFSVRDRQFDIARIADFYQTNVIPYIIGWIAFAAAGNFLVQEVLPPSVQEIASPAMVVFTYGAVATSLVTSIVKNAVALYKGSFPWDLGAMRQPPSNWGVDLSDLEPLSDE